MRPKVELLGIREAGWYFTYRTGNDQVRRQSGTEVYLAITLKNNGGERSYVSITVKEQQHGFLFRCGESIILDPVQRFEGDIFLNLPEQEGHPTEGETLTGMLLIEPSGNQRLKFWGKKFLKKRLEVPYTQDKATMRMRG